MTTLPHNAETAYTWPQIEAAMLAIDPKRFTAAARLGDSAQDGAMLARADLCHDLKLKLEEMEHEAFRRATEACFPRGTL